MEKNTVVLLRDTIFKAIKYYNKTYEQRMQPPMVIRLDNDVRIDTSSCAILWDDDNEVAYYFGSVKQFSQVQSFGTGSIEYKAILGAFDYGEIQEIYMMLNNEAFGQAVAVLNANAPSAKGTFLEHAGITEDNYRGLWQKYIDALDPNKTNNEYMINAKVIFHANDGTDKVVTKLVRYAGTKVKLIDSSELGVSVNEWNTASDGSGRSYPVGYELTPTSKVLDLYAIR